MNKILHYLEGFLRLLSVCYVCTSLACGIECAVSHPVCKCMCVRPIQLFVTSKKYYISEKDVWPCTVCVCVCICLRVHA